MKPRTILLAAAIPLLASCAPKPEYLYVDPAGRIELRRTVGLVSRREVPLPLADCAFYRVRREDDGGAAPPEEIWRVMTLDSERAALALRYGVVPEGFLQVTPQGASPPPLEKGRRYVVECSGDAFGVTEFELPDERGAR